jgi:iron complex transport system ATP-binding protein
MSVIAVQDLSIGYGRGRHARVLLEHLDLTLNAGEFTILVGPNGAGKSTLIRTMSALQPALAGRVLLDGDDVHALPARVRARRLAVVLTQQIRTWGVTARDLVALGRHPHTGAMGTLTAVDHQAIDGALDATDASELAHRQIAELSDGERQRVMVARALAQAPRAMILDEVTAFLDLPHRVDILLLLRKLAHRTGTATLLSTHDLELALRVADRLWVLKPNATLINGTAEALSRAGVFDDVFPNDHLLFDREARRFAVSEAALGTAGEGPA